MNSTSTSDTAVRGAAPAEAHAKGAPLDLLLLRELYGPRKPLLAGNLGGAALLTAVLWETAMRAELVLWAILIAGVTLLRLALVKRFNATKPVAAEVPFWTWAYAAGAFAGGVLWGASAGLFQTPDGAINIQAYVLVIAGLSAAGLSGYAVCPLVFVAFLLPATIPFGLLLAVGDDGTLKPVAAALFFGWLAAMIGVAVWRSREIAETVGDAGAAVEDAVRVEIARENAMRQGLEKARVVAQLSHELRTPLNAIVGFSEAIKQGVFGPVGNPRYSAYADNIHDSGRHLLAVIERALAARALGAEADAVQEADVDLAVIAGEAAAMFERRAKQAGVALVVACEEPAPSIRGNPEKLKQILINLLSNAVKFTPPGGRITLEIATPRGAGVIMRVSDSGVGMEAEAIARALDPLLAPQRRGGAPEPTREGNRGVGLLIAKWLAELHGGRLTLDSAKGQGTRATVHLPGERLLLRVLAPESRGWSAAAE
jgi:signal transduction histidine kinase